MPHEIGNCTGGGQGEEDLARAVAAQELGLGADDGTPRFDAVDDDGLQFQGTVLDGFAPEASDFVGAEGDLAEAEAFRFIQQAAMTGRRSMAEVADEIIKGGLRP